MTFNMVCKVPVTQRKRMNHARITHIFSFLRGACVVCVIRRWMERGPSFIVRVRRRRFVRDFEFWTVPKNCASVVRYSWVGVRSLCVEYAWLCEDTRRPSVLMHRNWLETTRVYFRPLTPHLHMTHEQRTYHVYSTDIHWRSRSVRSVSDLCVGRASNVRGIFHRICSYGRRARYGSDSSVIRARFMRGFCVIRQWILSPTPQQIGQFLDAQARTHPMWVIRAWSAVWLVLNIFNEIWKKIFKLHNTTLCV